MAKPESVPATTRTPASLMDDSRVSHESNQAAPIESRSFHTMPETVGQT